MAEVFSRRIMIQAPVWKKLSRVTLSGALSVLAGATLLFFIACDRPNPTPQPEDAGRNESPQGELTLNDPRVRAVPPGVRVTAAYLRISNQTDQDDRLLAVRMPGAGRVEIHETIIDAEDVMRMRHLPQGLPIPARSTVELKSGGAHIMLMELTYEPRAGEMVELEFEFERAGLRASKARVFDAD